MADSKISALTATTTLADTDELAVASSGTSKKITGANLKAQVIAEATNATQAELDAHESDTSSVHGIADTAALYRSGGTDVAVADGGTGASTAVNARTNLEAARIHVGTAAPAAPANGDLWWDTDDTTTFAVAGVITIDDVNNRVGINTPSPLASLHLPAGTAAANTAPLRLTTQAAGLTAVEQGAVELVGNSLQFTQLAKRRGVAMSQSVRVTSTTVGNTTSESAVLLTAEHGANYLEVGKCEILTLLGTLEQRNNVNAFGTFRIKYAGVEIETVATSQSNAIAAGSPFVLRVWTTCRSTGGAGTMQVNTILEAVSEADKGATTLANIDTTTAQNTTVTFQWNETNAANILVVEQAFVQCVETNK